MGPRKKPSCSAKAGHPVRRGLSVNHRRHWNTGSSAFADDDSGGGVIALRFEQQLRQNTTPRSRRMFRARFGLLVSPSPIRGRRECRASDAPDSRVCNGSGRTHTRCQVTPAYTRHSPRNGFTACNALSPVTGFLATVIPEKLASRELDASVGASGPHDFAVRIKRRSSKAPTRPPHPAPTSVTIAKRPSVWAGRREL